MPRSPSLRLSVLPLLVSCLVASGALAREAGDTGLRLLHPFATPTPPGAPNGAAYIDITAGEEDVSLVGASSSVSEVVEIHDMSMEDGVMRMRRLERLDVAAGETLMMRPGGGEHLMLIGLEQSLQVGDRFPITLEFAERDSVTLEVQVREAGEEGQAAGQHGH
ncbi:hypothetical protein SAMN02745148_00351 [Modicisalibacter ilicicola DSM 19980]|uniref:Copper(I)-binding protein n=1 Tax=Modicisalibacter ilicicola DSM 19980 TaxID=1121942 RepID=A0A1M4T636_9GAMM|nr:copper chaperone PCu(A)C [Halomonas ilicicola]SHE39972.1 hypothetical protein SAMN02745148_00351 [Halomonas ilicicola DSM 19980]